MNLRTRLWRLKSIQCLVIGGSLLASFAAAQLIGSRFAQDKHLQPVDIVGGLAVATAELDMGEVWEEQGARWRLALQNQTERSIEIRRFLTSCSCTDVEPKSVSIPPGQVQIIALKLDLTERSFAHMGLSRRPFSITLLPIFSNDQSRSPGWKLHGTIKNRVTLDRPALHFGERPIHGGRAITEKVVATVHIRGHDLQVLVNPEIATVVVNPLKGQARRFEIMITPNPSLPPGSFKTEARINLIEPSGQRTPGAALHIAGEMQPHVRLLPRCVFLEPTAVGETAEAVVTLQPAREEHAIAVDHIETDSPGLRFVPVTIEGIPAGHAYRLRQAVTKEGDHASKARFVILTGKHRETLITVPLEVRYRGQANKTEVSPRIETRP